MQESIFYSAIEVFEDIEFQATGVVSYENTIPSAVVDCIKMKFGNEWIDVLPYDFDLLHDDAVQALIEEYFDADYNYHDEDEGDGYDRYNDR